MATNPYYRERLEQDLATYEEWYQDEITKMQRVKDKETLGYMEVRAAMYLRNVREIEKALEVLDGKPGSIDTDPGFIDKEKLSQTLESARLGKETM